MPKDLTTSAAALDRGAATDKGGWGVTWLGALGALAMTSCCILPLALVSLGVTGVFIGKLGALYQYHWYFLAFATAALGYGFWKAYRPAPVDCDDGACARPVNRTLMRAILWVSAAIVLFAVAFPYLAPIMLGAY